MTMMLAPFTPEAVTPTTPSWATFAKTAIYNHLTSKGFPIGRIGDDDNLLFIGESAPGIQEMAIADKKFSILMFQPNPFAVMSEFILDKVDTIYTINHEQSYLVKEVLFDRYGNAKKFKTGNWQHYPKPFEPPNRSRKLIGIVEPDFNSHEIFDRMYAALNAFVASKLYATEYDVAFYAYNRDTYDRLMASSTPQRGSPLYYLDDSATSPLHNIANMPNAVITTDVFKYNPILSGWAQRIPVIHPEWAMPHLLDKIAMQISSVGNAGVIHDLLGNLVNQLDKIAELEKSDRIQDEMIRTSLLGDLYGDYSRSRRFPNGS